jgi:hypothetical protein
MDVNLCWQDYIANPSTIDMAYNVLIDHALAENDRRYAFSFDILVWLLFFWVNILSLQNKRE